MRQVAGIYGDGTGRTGTTAKSISSIVTKPGQSKASSAATASRTVAVPMTDTRTGSYKSAGSAAKNASNTVSNAAFTGYSGNTATPTSGTSHNSGPFTSSPSVSGIWIARSFGCGRTINALGAGDYGYSSSNSVSNYLSQSLKAFLLGDYSNEKQTELSIGGSIASGLLNVDLPLDVRDFIYDVTHTKELEHPAPRIVIDLIAFIPVIGALKYTDDAADIIKRADDLGDVARQADNGSDIINPLRLGNNALLPNQGYQSFDALKQAIGSAGEGRHWHHIVEQAQIERSGFAPEMIHNTDNIISLDAATHARITGYYNRTYMDFTGGLSVRDWLAGQSYEFQYEFGLDVLRRYGVIK